MIMGRKFVFACAAVATVACMLVSGPSASGRPAVKPAPFHAQSGSWLSPDVGRMLGWSSCRRTPCTTVVGTVNGGTTWRRLATLAAPLTIEEAAGVTQLRFADDRYGWAFEPALWATSDGGTTWARQTIPGGGHLVLALAADAQVAYAVISPCRLNRLCSSPLTLWRTTPGATSWRKVDLALPRFAGFNDIVLALHGDVGYLAIPRPTATQPDVFDVTTDGVHWAARHDPCTFANDEFLSAIAPISDEDVALLCVGDPGFGYAEKRIVRSDDAAETFTPAGTTPLLGIISGLAATPDGSTLVVPSYSIGSWIYRTTDDQTWTTPVDLGDGGMGWNDMTFTTDRTGYVIHGPASSPWLPGELWRTTDGGATWGSVAIAVRR
jgi:photosystem II stability/assembly factor-like uncharacterized protein